MQGEIASFEIITLTEDNSFTYITNLHILPIQLEVIHEAIGFYFLVSE